jgi:hypothetical protein
VRQRSSQRIHAVRHPHGITCGRNQRKRAGACRPEALLPGPVAVCIRQDSRPQERHGLFERHVTDETLDAMTADDELTALAIDVAQFGLRNHHAFQPFNRVCHDALLIPVYGGRLVRVNLDS